MIPLNCFFDPIQRKNPKFKSLNKEYLMTLFQSPEYKETFLGHLQAESILEDYQSKLRRKLGGIVRRFFTDKEEFDRESIHQYFNTNKQCKLPWRIQEIKEAI